ncbi:M1 family metallopeptidase [Salinimicrobium sediminilitoris]|uniref:M1 family metallopeptidase n=1 Tax=Salinimicrobium sediminilitoris TaxID=2876715 RepID=UPI001E49F468|nr:M1 family metallopeptidase [Salinimicrobium sediminilitoris]MCC8358958.1 M1 family metallopeptidase [Salinimicrobium sediminilitoris]
MRFSALFFLMALIAAPIQAQVVTSKSQFTEADTLRGSLRPERNYDVLKYNLQVKVVPEEKYISGFNGITFKAEDPLPVMQVDLFRNMDVDSILFRGRKMKYDRRHDAVFIDLAPKVEKNEIDSIQFFYSGNPIVAKNAPWDGGFVFEKDQQGNSWIAVAVQGTGASLWYPNKDHQSDEPEEALIGIAVPNELMNVSNGRFLGKEVLDNGYTRWNWKVNNPINNYNIVLNIGNYVHFKDKFRHLDLDYYVLPYNLEKAKKQFEEVKFMMNCFYGKFGAYPFEEDGFKLVETPYLGMEHQSAVAYGNEYKLGYLGNDLSGTGIGLKWDFIIIHETGHEWFGNSITAKDIADMWIHEGFTSYSEAVYIECRWGKEEALEYLQGIRNNIGNTKKIIGTYGVNSEGSGDMYYKGANLLNTIRSIYNDDELWWKTLKDYTKSNRHKIITTQTTEDFFNAAIDYDLQPVFDQYLRYASIPELQFKKEEGEIFYKWQADVEGFNMPVDILIKGKETRIYPTQKWQKMEQQVNSPEELQVKEKEFYIKRKNLKQV